MSKADKDIVLGLGLASVFAIILFVIIPNSVVVPSNIKTLSLRPDFWPGVLCAALIGLSLLMAGFAFYRKMKLQTKNSKQNEDYPKKSQWHLGTIKPILIMGGLIVYYFMLEFIGIVLSSTFAILGLALLYGERKFSILVPLSVILPIVLYFFFTKIANIPLPTGIIF